MSDAAHQHRPKRRGRRIALAALAAAVVLAATAVAFTRYESYASVYDASYVGSRACAECHTVTHAAWVDSPHAKMVQNPSPDAVVGDFADHAWSLPAAYRDRPEDAQPLVRMYRENDGYYMALRRPGTDAFHPFRIDKVVGYQYRQVYLHREPDGVLRRMPLQWSVARGEFFPYWNLQEGSRPSSDDLWAQLRSQNSAWNLFCARCHVTKLDILEKSGDHTAARTEWAEDGIACEACHGPGSRHVNYFDTNYVNRLAAFVTSKVRGQPVAYIASSPKMSKGRDLSVCARCHGPDIMMVSTDAYRRYEPGYSGEGRINDLSPHFKEFPLQPGRRDPTVECWDDGRPKGIGMLFRSFIESSCYDAGEVRCYDCHDPHANKRAARPGRLEASEASNQYCLGCHAHLAPRAEEHAHHAAGTPGSFCYDCHMPHTIQNLVGGYERFTRSHQMSSIPDPAASARFGVERAPNACNECHTTETAEWSVKWMKEWYGNQGNQ